MNNDSQNLYFSVELLRNRITSRLIPILFVGILISASLSFARIPTFGFHLFMVVQIFLLAAISILFIARKRIRPETSALVMVGLLSLLLITGVGTLGLLSATFVAGPIISLYLMLLGYRKSSYASIGIITVYLLTAAVLFISGSLVSPAVPNVYVRSPIAWMIMIVAVGGVSLAFVAPFELVPSALERSEERFRLAFENANVGMCLTSLDGSMVKVNNAMCEMLGYDHAELERMNFSDITYPEDRKASVDFAEQAQGGGPSKISFEKRYVHKLGSIIWADVASSLIYDSQGKPENFITHIQNITEHKQTEEASRQSAERYRTLVTHSPDALYVHVEGRITLVNPAICRLLGASDQSQLIGKSVFEIVHPDYHAQIRGRWNLIFSDQPAPPLEEKFVRLDGTLVEVEAMAVAIDWQGSKGVQVIARDITERKRAEEALRESEERMRAIIEGTPHLFFYTQDAQARTTYVSPTVEQITGYNSDAWLQRQDWFVTDAKFNQTAKEKTYAHLHGEFTEESVLVEVRHANGNPILLEAYEYPVMQNGKVIGLQGVAHDITERKRTEDALRESESRLRAMFESSRDAIGVSKKGIHIFANPSYVKLFGFENNEAIVGTSIIDSIAPADRARMILNVQRRSAGEPVPKFYEARGMKVDGTEFDAEFNVSTYELQNEIYSVAVIRDITERKRSEEALRVSMEQMHSLAMRLENIREEERKSMSREVHDELGQMLTALRMDLMSLKKTETMSTPAVGMKLQSMLDLTVNAIKSVQDISARLRPGMLDDLGLIAAIEWQTEEFQKRSGISCSLRLPDRELTIDDERSTVLFRILQETLTNIARHAGAKHITVSLVGRKNEIAMTIDDDGIGISDEQIRNPKSLGLLGIRERLHPFHGVCSIQRKEEGGTEVRIQLPIILS